MKRKSTGFTAQELRAKSLRDAASPIFTQASTAHKGAASPAVRLVHQQRIHRWAKPSDNQRMFYPNKQR
jgi:hypothetical protein